MRLEAFRRGSGEIRASWAETPAARVAASVAARWAVCAAVCLTISAVGVGTSRAEPAACLAGVVEAQAAEVPDARSVRLDDGRVLRVAGLEPFSLLDAKAEASEAKLKARLAALAVGALQVQIVSEKPDRYGRLSAMIAVGGSLIQATLASDGLAVAFAGGDPLPCFDRILFAEADARGKRRGFWTDPILPAARPDALETRIGRFTIFEGRIISVANRSATTYIDFGRIWRSDVTIEIPRTARDSFGGEAALEKLAGARIRARGFLQERNGPLLIVRSPMQLEILDEARLIAP